MESSYTYHLHELIKSVNKFKKFIHILFILLHLCIKFQVQIYYSLSITKNIIFVFYCSFIIRNLILKFYTQIENGGKNMYNFFRFFYKFYYFICAENPSAHDTSH
jgi:hypothetical protein